MFGTFLGSRQTFLITSVCDGKVNINHDQQKRLEEIMLSFAVSMCLLMVFLFRIFINVTFQGFLYFFREILWSNIMDSRRHGQ